MPLLTCQQLLDLLSDYVEGRLSAEEAARLDEHLSLCPPCVDYLNSFRATLAACRAVGEAWEAADPLPEELVQAILKAQQSTD
jgi:anti-sigma factor RsiW